MSRITGFGMWVAFHTAAHKNRSWFWALDEMRQRGVKWCALRVGEHTSWHMKKGGPFGTEEFVLACQRNNIKPVSWAYCYPREQKKQADFIREILDSGFENHIINAEIEWTGKHSDAEILVKQFTPAETERLAHAPLAWLDYHPNWPYKQFAALGDTHPQLYWTELLRGNYADIVKAGGPWDDWEKRYEMGDERALSPIGCTYGKESVFAQRAPGFFYAEDLAKFMERAKDYAAYSLYSWEAAAPACMEWLKNWHDENLRNDARLFSSDVASGDTFTSGGK